MFKKNQISIMKRICRFIIIVCVLPSFQVEKLRDMVPDEKTAIKIAEAVWLPIYGKDIYNERPFKASLEGDSIWIVHGSLPKTKKSNNEIHITFGGVAYCHIRKKDGTILQVIHTK